MHCRRRGRATSITKLIRAAREFVTCLRLEVASGLRDRVHKWPMVYGSQGAGISSKLKASDSQAAASWTSLMCKVIVKGLTVRERLGLSSREAATPAPVTRTTVDCTMIFPLASAIVPQCRQQSMQKAAVYLASTGGACSPGIRCLLLVEPHGPW